MSIPGEFMMLVGRSLTLLEQEHPLAYTALQERLRKHCLYLEVDGERFSLFPEGDTLRLGQERREATVELCTGRRTLLDVLENRLPLLDVVLRDRLRLRGTVKALSEFHEALVIYMRGAVRCPSFPELLQNLRRQAALLPANGAPSPTPVSR